MKQTFQGAYNSLEGDRLCYFYYVAKTAPL